MLYKLYLDETGTISDKVDEKYFPYFILSGLLTNEFQNEQLKIHADRIKFKYWGNIHIIFHSREIGKREGDFKILKDPEIEISFHNDLIDFLSTKNDSKCIVAAVNKKKAVALGWKQEKIYSESVNAMIKFFAKFLQKKKSRGQIFIESAGSQKDILFMKQYSHFLSNGIPEFSLDQHSIKEILTSISFVSKRNFDIETQIADLLAYPAGSQCLCEDYNRKTIANSYEEKMLAVLNSKLIKLGSEVSFIKLP